MMAGPDERKIEAAGQQSAQQDRVLSSDGEIAIIDGSCEDERCHSSGDQLWHCVDCDSNYCSECWVYQGPHKAGKFGRDGVPHERTDVEVVTRLKKILQPPETLETMRLSHEKDQCTKWFGVSRDVTGKPRLEDYGRYATLMGSIQPLDASKNRFPQLVSFIGVTNAGKSTIIKMLVNHTPAKNKPPKLFPTPVVGSITNDKVPTSGDVHLYADQSTHAGPLPILYADCEGFEGGESTPLGARLKKRSGSDPRLMRPEFAQARSLPIEWANTEESRQREYAVKELYPRLLYTFSDVVVFVLRNRKTFQSAVLAKLLEWGASALEQSLNQPSLPHAIVLLNDTEPGVDEAEWETAYATRSLLSGVKSSLDYVDGVPRFRELAQYWRDLGKKIMTVEDLILRYYSSFKVVRMPRKPRYMLIDRQIGRLQDEIRANCDESCKVKRKARMLTNSDELNVYLQSAFEHFTHTLTTPFNFVAVSLLNNPISYDFGGHMLQLANTIAAQQPLQRQDSRRSHWLFEKMCIMVASCVMLDCARYRKGRMEELFDSYKKFFDWTLNEYCDMSLLCNFSNGEGRHCKLVRVRHNTKGHQDDQGIIAHGDFQSSFTAEGHSAEWERQLKSAISAIQRDFQCEQDHIAQSDHAIDDEKIALRLHRQYAQDFFEGTGSAMRIFSHASCFCCLMEVPEHPLPCGHVLCSACVQAYGQSRGRCAVELSYCPLHMDSSRWSTPHLVKFKHRSAGTRILCLDGGGIRGIVELEVLRAIEQAMGGKIPIQAFFDLIVGTSTGGIIAIALGVQQWRVSHCIEIFTSLCEQAYTPRMRGLPILDYAASIGHGSKYKTRSFHGALKDAFGEKEYFFGGRSRDRSKAQTKVSVTSTTSTGGKAIVIANYRRREDTKPEYDFERPHEPELEMRVWEAAAATSAAPTYFKPFVNPLTRRTYLDGALQNNNPAKLANRERKLIWSESAEQDPDIFLSLGTGQNRISVLPKLSAKTTDCKTLQCSLQATPLAKPRGLGRYLRSLSVLYNRVDDILNAEMAWAAFRADVVGKDGSTRNSRRYIRFNPDLARCAPSVDAKDDLRSLQATVKKRLAVPHCREAVQHVAHRLIASSFFLDVLKRTVFEDGSHRFDCSVVCKFEDGTQNLRALGRFLNKCCGPSFQPHLVVKRDAGSPEVSVNNITGSVIDRMIDVGQFEMETITVAVNDDTTTSSVTLVLSPDDGLEPDGFALSGFPKVLAKECVLGQHTSRSRTGSPRELALSPHSTTVGGSGDSPQSTLVRSGRISLSSIRPKAINKHIRVPSRGTIGLKQLVRDSSAPEVHMEPTPIAGEPQISYREVKGPNRFWKYIGPAHMAKNRHLYTPHILEKFLPSIAAEPVELDAGDESEIKRMPYAELDGTPKRPQRASIYHEVHGDSSPQIGESEAMPTAPPPRSDSARGVFDSTSVMEAVMGDYRIRLPGLPFTPPPAFPPKKRGFDPGELESAIQAAFG